MSVNNRIYFIDRKTKVLKEEIIYFEPALRFLYGSPLGKFFNLSIAHCALCSKITGWWQRLPFTKRKIAPFVQKYALDPSEFEKPLNDYSSFDAFFIRKLKKEARPLAEGAILPADGRYLFYQNIASCDGFVVKGKKFSLEKLLANRELANSYAQGSMAIARLAPCDYHRFHFPVECTASVATLINGPLFSVNPIAVKQNIELLAENKRVLTQLTSTVYGKILFLEIGATNVGSIHQTYLPGKTNKKGEEKGYFSFGGSSIILLFEPNRIQFAQDLIDNSAQHIETLCLFGQPLEKQI